MLLVSFFFCGCSNQINTLVLNNMSDLRKNYFNAQTEDYYIELSCGQREEVFAYDGISTNKVPCGVLVLEFANVYSYDYVTGTIDIDGQKKEIILKKSPFEYKYMVDLNQYLTQKNKIKFSLKNTNTEVVLTEVSHSWKIDYKKAISIATNKLKNKLENLYFNQTLNAEAYLKIVTKKDFNKTFWYFSYIDRAGQKESMLIDVNSGKII